MMEEHQILFSTSPTLRTCATGTSSPILPRTTRPQRISRSESVSSGTKTLPPHPHKIAVDLRRRHPDLWFDDGSVICQAEDTLFKVHISQLSRHSVFFRDMFSLPQPKAGPSNLAAMALDDQDIAAIYLHDKAEDVGNLLTALYDGPYVFSSDVSSLLILRAKKLRVQRSG